MPSIGLPCQDTPDARPVASWCWGLEGAEGWVLPGELRCHPAAKTHLGQVSVSTPGLRQGEEMRKEPAGPHTQGKGACVGYRWAAMGCSSDEGSEHHATHHSALTPQVP